MTRKLSFLSPLHLLLYCCPHALNPPLHLPKIPPSIWLDPSTPSCLHRLSILFQVEVKYTPVCLFNKLVGSYFFCSYTTHAPRSSLTPSIFSSFCLTATFAMSSCCSFTLPHTANPAQFILFSLSYFPKSTLLCQYFSHLLLCHLSSSSFISLSFHPSSCHNSNPAVQGAITSPTLSFFLCPIPPSPLLTL